MQSISYIYPRQTKMILPDWFYFRDENCFSSNFLLQYTVRAEGFQAFSTYFKSPSGEPGVERRLSEDKTVIPEKSVKTLNPSHFINTQLSVLISSSSLSTPISHDCKLLRFYFSNLIYCLLYLKLLFVTV